VADTDELTRRIKEHYADMSKGQKRISDFILSDYDKAAFMTAAKLAQKVGTSESTVVRYASMLGYDGYASLQKALADAIRDKLTTVQRIEMTSALQAPQILKFVMKADAGNIKATIQANEEEEFAKIVDVIFSARRVYILGMRSSAPLAQFLAYYLNYLLDNVQLVTSGINDILEQMIHISDEDVVIGISFPRYGQKTLDGMRFAHERGAGIVAITDSALSPLCDYADHTLFAMCDISTFVDSLVAPMSIINALLVGIAMKKKDTVSHEFELLESIWDEYHVYLQQSNEP